jgi:hypothetical protein
MLRPTSVEILNKLQGVYAVSVSQFNPSGSEKEEGADAELFKTSYSELKILKIELEQSMFRICVFLRLINVSR